MKHKSQIKIVFFLFIFSLALIGSLKAQKSITVGFEVTNHCLNYTVLKNISSSNDEVEIIGYLWEISEASGDDLVITTTENPNLSFDPTGNYSNEDPIRYNCKLTALTDGHGDTSITKSIFIDKSPIIDIENWDDLVCSNADSSFYEIQSKNGYSYHWEIPNDMNKYIREYSGEYTNRLEIAWDKLDDEVGTEQFNLACTITSDETSGMCNTVISEPVILLSSAVPSSENLEIIAKSGDPSILFCIIENPENYYFVWGYKKSNDEIHTEVRTEENFYRWEDGLNESWQYFVEIQNKNFTYCTTTIFYDKKKSEDLYQQDVTNLVDVLNIYPNPATDNIHIDLMKNSDKQESVSISVFNFMGTLENTYQFELTDEISKLSIPVGLLSSGHYFLKFDVSNSQSLVKKFVVINK